MQAKVWSWISSKSRVASAFFFQLVLGTPGMYAFDVLMFLGS